MFLWCIFTDLPLVSSSPYDYGLSLYVILKALSWIRFILLLSPILWNIHIGWQYPNCDSINIFMIIHFLLIFIKGVIRASALSFRLAFLHQWLTWLSNFNSWSIFIPRKISVLLESIGKQSTIAVIASAQSIMRWCFPLFAFMKLLLYLPKSRDEDSSSALMTESFFSFTI